jgi:hypothetical protein
VVRNITFSLPPELIRRAKILAAQRDLSLNALVHQTLESAVDAQDRSLQAGNRLLRKSQVGLYDIPPRSWKRSDFYE